MSDDDLEVGREAGECGIEPGCLAAAAHRKCLRGPARDRIRTLVRPKSPAPPLHAGKPDADARAEFGGGAVEEVHACRLQRGRVPAAAGEAPPVLATGRP